MQPEKILSPEWKRQAHGKVPHVYVTPDGSHIVAASEDHDVYLMEYSGKLLWASTTGDDVVFAKCSDDGQAVASYSRDNAISFFSHKGELLWTARVNRKISCMDLAPDGGCVIAGSVDGTLRAFDRKGEVAWSKTYPKPVTAACISGSGALVLAGNGEGRAYMYDRDGALRWEFTVDSPIIHVYTSYDGELSYVLETKNNTLHLVSDRGGELAETSYSQRVTDIAITDDGRYVAIGFANSFVYFTDKNGQQLWKKAVPGPVERIEVAGDGSLVFVTTAAKGVYVLNKKGDMLLTFLFDAVATGLDATYDGAYFVASSMDTVYMFAIGRYLQYIAREQVKMLKLMGEAKAWSDDGAPGRKVVGRPGGPTEAVNTCRRCGEEILPGRMFCNYCEILNRRGQ